jgi:hypothetical protein
MIRCARYQDRPSQADQLHLDLWWHGVNIACDAGSYLYNGPPPWRNGLAKTCVHNTVMVDNADQMSRAGIFLWLDWAQGSIQRFSSSKNGFMAYFQGEHDGYRRLPGPAIHRRSVLRLPEGAWLVYDYLDSTSEHDYCLHWLLPRFSYIWEANKQRLTLQTAVGNYAMQVWSQPIAGETTIVLGDEASTRGWHSIYYGAKEPALSVALQVRARKQCNEILSYAPEHLQD